jgi:hypothetical protein
MTVWGLIGSGQQPFAALQHVLLLRQVIERLNVFGE